MASSGSQASGHGCEFDTDDAGWDIATCVCGWVSPPSPDPGTAADFYADHFLSTAQTTTTETETPQ